MASASRGSGGVQRVLLKLKKSIEDGNFYEAHQMYRTLFFRYKNQSKFAEAIDLLYSGATTLLHHNQHASGADLALLLVEILNTSSAEVESAHIDKIGHLHRLIRQSELERESFVAASLKWSSSKRPEHRLGHPKLHEEFALTLWNEKNFAKSCYHFIHSVNGEGCANMLIEYHITLGYPSEVDLFIARAVFQYLCLRNKTTAEEAFSTYTRKHPQVGKGPPFMRPLLNFLWFLLLAIQGGKVAVFTVLCEQYKPSLDRDPSYLEYLDRIGQLFFGLPPPKSSSGQGALFDNLLQSLLGMGEEEMESPPPRMTVTDEDVD